MHNSQQQVGRQASAALGGVAPGADPAAAVRILVGWERTPTSALLQTTSSLVVSRFVTGLATRQVLSPNPVARSDYLRVRNTTPHARPQIKQMRLFDGPTLPNTLGSKSMRFSQSNTAVVLPIQPTRSP